MSDMAIPDAPASVSGEAIDDLRRRVQPLRDDPGSLLEALYVAQDIFGYVPREAVEALSEELGYPEAHVYGVVTFYTMFYTEPQATHILRVCRDIACHVNGAAELVAAIEARLGVPAGHCTEDGQFKLEVVSCLGQCDHQPALLDNLTVHGEMTPEGAVELIDRLRVEA